MTGLSSVGACGCFDLGLAKQGRVETVTNFVIVPVGNSQVQWLKLNAGEHGLLCCVARIADNVVHLLQVDGLGDGCPIALIAGTRRWQVEVEGQVSAVVIRAPVVFDCPLGVVVL